MSQPTMKAAGARHLVTVMAIMPLLHLLLSMLGLALCFPPIFFPEAAAKQQTAQPLDTENAAGPVAAEGPSDVVEGRGSNFTLQLGREQGTTDAGFITASDLGPHPLAIVEQDQSTGATAPRARRAGKANLRGGFVLETTTTTSSTSPTSSHGPAAGIAAAGLSWTGVAFPLELGSPTLTASQLPDETQKGRAADGVHGRQDVAGLGGFLEVGRRGEGDPEGGLAGTRHEGAGGLLEMGRSVLGVGLVGFLEMGLGGLLEMGRGDPQVGRGALSRSAEMDAPEDSAGQHKTPQTLKAPDADKPGDEVAQGNGLLQIGAAPDTWNETKADAVGHGDGFFQLSDCGCGSSAGCDCGGEGEAAHPGRIKWVHRLGAAGDKKQKEALRRLCTHGKNMATRALSTLGNAFRDDDCVTRLAESSRVLQYEGDSEDVWLAVFWKEREAVEFYLLPKAYSRQTILAARRYEEGKQQRGPTWSDLEETYTGLVGVEKASRSKWGRFVRTTSVAKPIPAPYSPRGLAFRFQLGLTVKQPRSMLEACANQDKGMVAKILGTLGRARAAMVKENCAQLSLVLAKVVREYEEFPGGGPKGVFLPGANIREGGAKAVKELFYEDGAEEGEGVKGKGLDDAEAVSEHGEPSEMEIAIIGTTEKSGHACAYEGPPQLACLFLQHEKGAASLSGDSLSAFLVRGSFLQVSKFDPFSLLIIAGVVGLIALLTWYGSNGDKTRIAVCGIFYKWKNRMQITLERPGEEEEFNKDWKTLAKRCRRSPPAKGPTLVHVPPNGSA
ncbi:unnamed protein product [Amoebophrya sp. A25]|nr:unnamed protein product [Amoebophrya sp. A25]|eukprot:GSA25T00022110001.1